MFGKIGLVALSVLAISLTEGLTNAAALPSAPSAQAGFPDSSKALSQTLANAILRDTSEACPSTETLLKTIETATQGADIHVILLALENVSNARTWCQSARSALDRAINAAHIVLAEDTGGTDRHGRSFASDDGLAGPPGESRGEGYGN
jgi:hypothetical protein